MNGNQDNSMFGVIIGSMVVGLLALGVIAILSEFFNNSTTSKGKLLARKERYVMERTEYYEREAEHQRVELLKTEIFEPKRFVEIYGRKME
jgi:hypothetical protein